MNLFFEHELEYYCEANKISEYDDRKNGVFFFFFFLTHFFPLPPNKI